VSSRRCCHIPGGFRRSDNPTWRCCRVFDHWEMITQDPMKAESPSNVIMLDVRKRKGLKPEPNPITEYEDKL